MRYNEAMIVGIDEVGRGPWAGPLVVGAVVLGEARIDGLNDSKKVSKTRRLVLVDSIIEHAQAYGLGWVDAGELDSIGLAAALRLATRRALEQITVPYHEIIIDGTVNFLAGTQKGEYVTTMKQADALIAAVSAASIIAKVARDDYMESLSDTYPGYGFERHVGYGTAAHRRAIETLGVTAEHRRSFAPIARVIGDISQKAPERSKSTNTDTGNRAESVVAQWLDTAGYEILERNWKTRFCEIDIIALKDGRLYFVEVKHRASPQQGGGIAAITPRKLRQMRFAATLYLSRHGTADAQLAVVTTTGQPVPEVEELLVLE